MTKRLFLLLVPLALCAGSFTTALLLGAKTGTSKGNYWIYFCRIGVGAAAGRDGVKTVGPVEPGYVANMLGKIASLAAGEVQPQPKPLISLGLSFSGIVCDGMRPAFIAFLR